MSSPLCNGSSVLVCMLYTRAETGCRSIVHPHARTYTHTHTRTNDKTTLTDECVAVGVHHLFILTLGRFQHESVADRPRDSRGVEPVVLEPLGDVDGIHVSRGLEVSHVQDELVGIEA